MIAEDVESSKTTSDERKFWLVVAIVAILLGLIRVMVDHFPRYLRRGYPYVGLCFRYTVGYAFALFLAHFVIEKFVKNSRAILSNNKVLKLEGLYRGKIPPSACPKVP